MLTLQKSFSYAGDSATKLIRSVNIVFDVPVFGYFDVGGDKDARLVDRTIAATKEVSISLAIDAKDYRVDLGSDFVVGRDKSMLALVKKYYADIKQVQQIEGLIVPVGVRYLTVTGASIGEQKLELIHYPKLDLQKSTDIVRASAANLLTSERLTLSRSISRHISIFCGSWRKPI